jgi:hypothetical protein
VPNIQQRVNSAFYGSAMVKPTKAVTVDVYNGSGTPELATEAAQAFAALGYTPGQAANPSAQAQTVQGDSQVFYGPGAEQDGDLIADEVGALTATSLPSLPPGHVEVLLGSQVTALPAGLETFGGTTVSAQDFMTAAAQDGLPATEVPPASTVSTPAAGTQSVNSVLFGAQPQAPGRPMTNPSPQSSNHVGSSADSVSVSASARYGIPCVY